MINHLDAHEHEVARFNRLNPIGSKVKVHRGGLPDPAVETYIVEPGAYVLGGHTPVVQVENGGCIALTHVAESVVMSSPSDAMAAEQPCPKCSGAGYILHVYDRGLGDAPGNQMVPCDCNTPPTPQQDAPPIDEERRLQRLLMDAQAQCPPSYSEVWMRCIQPMLDHRSNQLIAANAEIDRLKRELEVVQAKAFRVSSVAYAQRNDIVVRDTLIRQLTDALRATKDAAEYDGPNFHNGYLLYLKSVDLRDRAIAAAESMTKDGTNDVS